MSGEKGFKNFIMTVASSIGIEKLDPNLAAALGPDIEYRLREVVQEAIKFMKHAKRETLLCSDVNHALALLNVEQLFGFSSLTQRQSRYIRAAGSVGLFFPHDDVVDFNQVLQEPLPPVPRDVSFLVHWLAIEGVQPAIPQNPSMKSKLSAQLKKKKTGPIVKPVVAHVLSVELQRYFEEVTQAVLGNRPAAALEKALGSVSHDPGLNDLLPYFVQFVAEQVTKNLQNLGALVSIMRFVDALVKSEHFHLEPYLHQLVPAVLTCVVGKQLCADPASEDHWSLRDAAAKLTAAICEKFGPAYATLQPRVAKTLVQALLDLSKPLTTQYGAIRGIGALGNACKALLLFPNLPEYVPSVQAAKEEQNALKRLEAGRVLNALLEECTSYLCTEIPQAKKVEKERGGKRAKSASAAEEQQHQQQQQEPAAPVLANATAMLKQFRDVFGAQVFDKHAKESLELAFFK